MCRSTNTGILILISFLVSCAPIEKQSSPIGASNGANSVSSPQTEQSLPTQPTEQQKAIALLLSDADFAFSQKQYMSPIEDNAHDRYRSVLLLDPHNEHAKQGLQMIAMKYVEMARKAALRGNFNEAQTYLKYARSMGDNPLVQDETESLRKQMLNLGNHTAPSTSENEWVLDTKLVQSKDATLKQKLATIAKKAKESDQFVLIIARSDAEGRWIYQQLRSAVPGYLVRGDIRLGTPARVKLVSSLE